MLWVYSFLSDYYQTRWIPIMIQATLGLIPSIIMIVWDVPLGAKYFSCKHDPHVLQDMRSSNVIQSS